MMLFAVVGVSCCLLLVVVCYLLSFVLYPALVVGRCLLLPVVAVSCIVLLLFGCCWCLYRLHWSLFSVVV